MNLNQLYAIVRDRWVTVVSVVVLALAVATGITLSMTPQYAATARVFISTDLSADTNVIAGSQFSAARVTSYASFLEAEELLQQVATELDSEMTPQQLREKITATVEPDTTIIGIAVEDPEPSEAKRIADVAAAELADYVETIENPEGKERAPVKATVQTASADGPPVSPRLVLNLTVAALLGLLLGIAIAIVRDMRDDTIKGRDDLGAAAQAPVLGHLEFDPDVPNQPLLTQGAANAPRSEAFRVIRSNMQFLDVDSPPRAIVITSSVAGEGKTTVATNLAISLAQTGQRILLIECDLRRPTIAATLGLESAVGLTSVLIGRGSFEDCVQHHRRSGIDVLTAGPLPPNPAELLQSEAVTKLLDQASSVYDMTVLDAPPLLPVADAAVLTRQVDSAILVVRHGSTTRSQVESSRERLTTIGGRLLGAVVNMTPRRSPLGYGYGYGYGVETAPASHSAGGTSGSTASLDGSRTGGHRRARRREKRLSRRALRQKAPGSSAT